VLSPGLGEIEEQLGVTGDDVEAEHDTSRDVLGNAPHRQNLVPIERRADRFEVVVETWTEIGNCYLLRRTKFGKIFCCREFDTYLFMGKSTNATDVPERRSHLRSRSKGIGILLFGDDEEARDGARALLERTIVNQDLGDELGLERDGETLLVRPDGGRPSQ